SGRKLVGIGKIGPIAEAVVLIDVIVLRLEIAANLELDTALAIVQRLERLEFDHAADAALDKVGALRLVDEDTVHQFRGKLLESDRKVRPGGRNPTPVNSRKAERRAKPAHRQFIRIALEAIGGDTDDTLERVADRIVGGRADLVADETIDHHIRIALEG